MLTHLDEFKASYGAVREWVLADAAYCNLRDLSALEEKGLDGYVPLGRESKKAAEADAKSRPATACFEAKLVGAFPDGQSALTLVAGRLRHVWTT